MPHPYLLKAGPYYLKMQRQRCGNRQPKCSSGSRPLQAKWAVLNSTVTCMSDRLETVLELAIAFEYVDLHPLQWVGGVEMAAVVHLDYKAIFAEGRAGHQLS